MYAAIGYGGMQVSGVIAKARDILTRIQKPVVPELPPPEVVTERKRKSRSKDGVIIEGMDNMLVKFAKCCNPLPGDPIIGFINRGTGVTIHKRDCMNITAAQFLSENGPRLVSAEWDADLEEEFHASIEIEAIDRIGLVADVSMMLANLRIPIYAMKTRTTAGGVAFITLTFGVTNREHLDNIIAKIRKIKDITSVERLLK